jgi:imidazole glycerol-phosphate synthase subunit HisF
MIFTLLYNRGAFMLSRNFRLQKVGDLHWLQKNYNFSRIAFSIDELIVLNVSRGERDLNQFCDCLKSLTEGCFVPIAAGGGVRSVSDARKLLRSGADKIVVNTPLFDNEALIRGLAEEFGQQCIVASIDVKYDRELGYRVWVENGEKSLDGNIGERFAKVFEIPVGEIYLNSIDMDGTGQGYDLQILNELQPVIPIPVIIAGGAGQYHHLAAGLKDDRIDAVATAHLFNFVGDGLAKARLGLMEQGFSLGEWDIEKAGHI